MSPFLVINRFFRGNMLIQFSDSSCRYAQRSINIRYFLDRVLVSFSNTIGQAFEIDIKNEQYVFEMMFNDDTTALQFSCASQEEMRRWIAMITLALSASVIFKGCFTIYS